MRVPSVPTAAGIAVAGLLAGLALLAGLDSGALALPPYLDGTLLRAVPIFLTATVMVCAFNGASVRASWLLVAGPSLAYTLFTFVSALGPVHGVAVGVGTGVAIAAFVTAAGHATGRGYRELVESAVEEERADATGERDATR